MTLPNANITPIPDTEPDAVPSLWNVRYTEIDDNFENLDGRAESMETEVSEARGGESALDDRLDQMQSSIAGMNPDFQNALVAAAIQAVSEAGLANREVVKTLNQRLQTGVVTIANRGIKTGCSVTKSGTATRNLSLAAGAAFLGGRLAPVLAQTNGASVQSNNTAGELSCYAYLFDNSGVLDFACTNLGAEAPDGAIVLYRVDVPAGNTEATDPNLDSCSVVDLRRLEPEWPTAVSTSPTELVALDYDLLDDDFHVVLEVEDFAGSSFQLGYVYVGDKASNGFSIYMSGAADSVQIRWTVRKTSL